MSQRYPIPVQTIRTEIIIKRSRFIATVGHAETVKAARAFIQQIRAEMPDASHHVYAFRVGYGSSVQEGLSDDGEPAGTSGKPTMAVLRGSDIGDIALVITRYFGGIKLGTGGLVRAYSSAAKKALDMLPLIEKVSTVSVEIPVPYSHYDQVKRLLPDYQATILEEIFAKDVTLKLKIPQDIFEVFSARIREFTPDNTAIIFFA